MQSANDALNNISIRQESVRGARVLHPARRTVQYLTLLILIVIPVSGFFRIDLAAGCVTLLDRQVWFSDILILLGLWVCVASSLVLMYSVVGSVFCGWMCPQNTAAEYANKLTARLLGRSADMMDISGEQMQVAARKKSVLNYVLLAIGLLLPAMLYALIPLLYFFPPSVIWSFITFSSDVQMHGSLYWIYTIFVSLFLLDIAVIRHLLCKHMCMYRVWQESFKKKQTLHIHYDEQRSDDCTSCHYCVDSCFLDIDPRKTEVFDGCINCGECVTACDSLHSKSKKLQGPGLLRFAMGNKKGVAEGRSTVLSCLTQSKLALMAMLAGGVLFMLGLMMYQTNEFSVYYNAQTEQGGVSDYRINIAHKLYRPATVTLQIKGLDGGYYSLEKDTVNFDDAGRQDVLLHINTSLPKGLYRFVVVARSDDGWTSRFKVSHFVSGTDDE
ncbi:MAG: 4Fe-4S dicluster domain-containing protein [Mariprofundus sp.]